MLVYHGSTDIVKKPDVLHSFRSLDFGKGFYVTTVKKQAERWAKRKADFSHGPKAFVNIYEFDSKSADIKDFGDDLNSWIDFVCDCRNGGEKYRTFEIIKGKVANDKVYRVVEFYNNGIWDKTRALEEIKIYDIYDQIAFISQKALDNLLHFQNFYEVSL